MSQEAGSINIRVCYGAEQHISINFPGPSSQGPNELLHIRIICLRTKGDECIFQSLSPSDQRFILWCIFSPVPLNCKQYLDNLCSALSKKPCIRRLQMSAANMRQGVVRLCSLKFQNPCRFVLPRRCRGCKRVKGPQLGEAENI